MPKNVFDPKNQGEMNLKRNAYDLSKSSVFTTDFFKLYPHFCQEVIPGDSFEIDSQVGFRALPTTFPLQTRVRVSQEFYYCRDRTLQDDFEDMIFKTKEIEHPWLRLTSERAKKMISIGSLGDAFNVPCTVGSDSSVISDSFFVPSRFLFYDSFRFGSLVSLSDIISSYPRGFHFKFNDSIYGGNILTKEGFSSVKTPLTTTYMLVSDVRPSKIVPVSGSFLSMSVSKPFSVARSFDLFFLLVLDADDNVILCRRNPFSTSQDLSYFVSSLPWSDDDVDKISFAIQSTGYVTYHLGYSSFYGSDSNYQFETQISSVFFVPTSPESEDNVYLRYRMSSLIYSSSIVDSTSSDFIASNPFVGENPQIRLNVLPFRAYTQVANYYYRFDKNNPYVLNGEAQYNEFIPTHASGPDDNEYDFHYRNWELDRFTSALQSPQFGQAPLVGLIWTGDKTVELTFDSDHTSDGNSYKVTVGVDDDDKIDSILDFSGDVPSADLQRLQRSIQSKTGLSINDLRVTNSFQRFLENVMRRGLRYRNQLKSHFGVSVDYPDIDIPQYIGGSSSYFDSGQVTNMAQGEAVLGDYNGTLQGGTATTNTIRCYCPEHGYIIGIVSITPIPSYAQSISKHMIKHDPFDYFTPEFGKIGFTPIHYSELSPLQNTGTQKPSDVFGYQKAWYDYMEALDEVHGDFRTTLRDFVLSRTFAERPQLSESFTVGSPDQLNDVFVTTKIADKYGSSAKFLGSARFHVRALRPIPMIGTPSLE